MLSCSNPISAVDLCMSFVKSQFVVCSCAKPQAAKPRAVWAVVAALILSAQGVAGDVRHPDAVPVFRCQFGDDWDVNYDSWPDRWVRKTGAGYPQYVNIAIQ